MFERFTPEARNVVVEAQEEARQLGHDSIGTEHLLIGVFEAGGSAAVAVLGERGIDARAVHEAVLDRIGRGEDRPRGHIAFTAGAKRALEMALRNALRLGHNWIGPEHILLGLLDEGEDTAARILIEAKLVGSLDGLRGALLEKIEALGPGWEDEQRSRRGGRADAAAREATTEAFDPRPEESRMILDAMNARLAAIEARLVAIEEALRDRGSEAS